MPSFKYTKLLSCFSLLQVRLRKELEVLAEEKVHLQRQVGLSKYRALSTNLFGRTHADPFAHTISSGLLRRWRASRKRGPSQSARATLPSACSARVRERPPAPRRAMRHGLACSRARERRSRLLVTAKLKAAARRKTSTWWRSRINNNLNNLNVVEEKN